MTSDYSDIYSRFLIRVTDYDFAGLDEYLANSMMNSWIKSVLSKPMVRRLFSSIIIDDDVEQIEYDLVDPWDDVADQDFVENLISIGMVTEWVAPKYHSVLNTNQFFSNKEQSFYSQANHMEQLKQMYEKSQVDFRKLIRDRGYNKSLLNGA